MVSGSYDEFIKIWNIKNQTLVYECLGSHRGGIYNLQFSATRMVTAGQDKRLLVWSYDEGVEESYIFE